MQPGAAWFTLAQPGATRSNSALPARKCNKALRMTYVWH